MRDLPPGSTDQAVTDFSDASDDVGETPSFDSPTASETSPQGVSTDAAPTNAPAPIDLPPLPQTSGSISWTGLSTAPAEAAPVEVAPVAVTPTEVAPAEVAQTETSKAADESAASGEKKVVWSSSPPDRYSSFGSSNRRDDY